MLLLLHNTSTSTCLGHSHNLGSTLLATPASELLLVLYIQNVQGYTKRWSQGLVNFVSALAYHFCLALSAAFTQPGNHLLAKPCNQYSLPLSAGVQRDWPPAALGHGHRHLPALRHQPLRHLAHRPQPHQQVTKRYIINVALID